MADVATTMIAPWEQWGIVGSVVIAEAVAVVVLWRYVLDLRKEQRADHEARLEDIRQCHLTTLDLSKQMIETGAKLANGLEGLEKVVEAVLARVKP